MKTILKVKPTANGQLNVSWASKHPKSKDIEKWLKHLSAGYVEYLLQFDADPHCNACRETECENVGGGDDACRAFKFGLKW